MLSFSSASNETGEQTVIENIYCNGKKTAGDEREEEREEDGIDLLIIGCKHTDGPSLTFDPTGPNCMGLLNLGNIVVNSSHR